MRFQKAQLLKLGRERANGVTAPMRAQQCAKPRFTAPPTHMGA